ncbi:MAG: Type 1 glutamine amidotransferase-like domain-containing protein [Candidatus Babeliales bacterium]
MPKKQIIAIGGGFRSPFTMEKYILSQVEKPNPKVSFLPQASAESKEYIVRFYDAFQSLGAQPSAVSLFGRVSPDWKERLLTSDVIFVGGGNTRSMLALWREWGVDHVLKEAYEKGIVLAGVSAGAICWFEQGITDSVWPLGVLECLGFLPGSSCPHYDTEPERRPTFLKLMQERAVKPGIALHDDVAAHYVDGTLHCVVSAKEGKKAYQISPSGEEEIEVINL